MADNRRIAIHFDVNGDELKKLETAVKTIESFNKHIKTLQQSAGSVANAFNQMSQSQQKAQEKQQNLHQMLKTFDGALKNHKSTIMSLNNAQKALSTRLEEYGRNIKVTMGENGKFSASLTNIHNQTVKLNGSFDATSGKISNLKTNVVTTNDAMTRLKEGIKQARLEAERMRGTDISNRLPSGRAWDVQADSLVRYGKVIQGSIDRNNKFTQTVVTQSGEVRKITGYYNQLDQKLIQYNEQVSKASKSQLHQGGFDNSSVQRIGLMAESMKGLNKYTLSWNEAMVISATRMVQWGVAGTAIFGTKRAITAMIETIIELDDQMTQINRVIDLTKPQMDQMFDGAIRNADTLGIKLTDINDAMIEYGRQGFQAGDIETLVHATGLLKNVADMDMTQASENMSAYLATFRKNVTDIGGYVDRLNEVDNKYSISVDQLAESVRRAGGTANAFGVTIDNLLGYTTAIGEATRESGSVIGNALKTIFSRITTMKDSEDALKSVGINIRNMGGDMKGVDQILGELHGKWDGLTTSQKQNLSVQIAGRYQLNRFMILMQNYDEAMKASQTSTKAWGSANRENQKYMESLRARINKLWTALQLLAKQLGEAGVGKAFAFLLDIATKMVTGFTNITKALGGFTFIIPVVVGLVTALVYQFRALSADTAILQAGLVTINPQITAMATRFGASTATATIFAGAVGRVTGGLRAMALATVGNPLFWIPIAIGAIAGLIGHMQQLKERQDELKKSAIDASKEYQKFVEAVNNKKVDSYQVEEYKKQVDTLKGSSKELNNIVKNNTDDILKMASGYDRTYDSSKKLANAKENMIKMYKDETTAMSVLNDAQENELASMGIKITKNTTIKQLTQEINDRQKELNGTISKAQKVMEEERLKGILPNADAYYDMSEAIDDTATAMENALGITDKMATQMKEQKALIELLSGVKNKDAVQTQLLDNAYSYWADMLGVSADQLKKHPELMDKQMAKTQELKDLTQKMADGEATAQEKRRAQQLLTAENAEKTAKREQDAHTATADVMKKAYDLKMQKLYEYDQRMEGSTSNTKVKVTEETSKVMEQHGIQKQSTVSTSSAYDRMSQLISDASKNQKNHVISNATEQNKAHKSLSDDETGHVARGWSGMWDAISKVWGWIKSLFGIKSSSQSSSKGSLKGNGIDRYATGTSSSGHPGGPAIVGEEGRELAYIPGVGTTILGQRGPEMLNLPKGSSVLPNKHTESLLKSYGFPGYAGGIGDYFDAILKGPKAVWDTAVSKFGLTDSVLPKWFTNSFGSPVQKIGSMAIDGIQGLIDKTFSSIGHGASGSVKNWIIQAMKITGVPGSWFDSLVAVAMKESGGNPRAVNNWDKNAKNGTPSMGLMQTIMPTFMRYAMPGMGNILNPVDNAVASIRYIMSRYGSVFNVPGIKSMASGGGYKGYAVGGQINNEQVIRVGEGNKREMIIPLEQHRDRALALWMKTGEELNAFKYFATGGVVGGKYTVRSGDTLSELAKKFYGNAYNGGLSKLLSLNPQIKNANRIYTGQQINVPGSSSSSGSSGSSATKPAPAQPAQPTFKTKDDAENYLSNGLGIVDNAEALGIRGSDYRVRNLTTDKYREAYNMTGKQYDYNKMVFDELSKFSNYNDAKAIFDKANIFLTSSDKAKALQNILSNIGQNVLKEINDNTSKWLDTFNKGVKDASDGVKSMLDISKQVNDRKAEDKKNGFVDNYVSNLLNSLGVADQVDPLDALKQKADDLKATIQKRAEESALLQYNLNSGDLQARLNELNGYKTQLETQMKAIETDFASRGINDSSLINQAKQPLVDRLAEITQEYNDLQSAIANGNQTLADNQAELDSLANEYKNLQDQIKKAGDRREYTDVWGNIVRDAEGNVKMVNSQGQTILDTYEKVRQELEAIQQTATSAGTSISPIIAPIIDELAKAVQGYNPQINTNVDPGTAIVNNNNSGTSETKTYEANTNVNRNVTYVVQTGVALASESELREFAKLLAQMIDEEEGRSKS